MNISEWAIGILSLATLSVVSDLLLNGRTAKFVKAIFASLTVIVIIAPIPSFLKGIGIDDNFSDIDYSYMQTAVSIQTETLNHGIEKYLDGQGVHGTQVSVTVEKEDIFAVKNVTVNLADAVIDKKYEHINKYELIAEMLSAALKISKGDVILCE